ncbi:hypothetical protein A1Q1_03943 [Trichosporon asahii var. asahii CBS 2479]|uniref:Uncharacterized protein n=1 Tax=Trichosporon asahii var. asahii (strain ATCC 90039 / CBS 2479 / JCM 2466 / KCTC 7840 / NBRC 103889/ NCYC 2677 / UAMH 7654) TaxID=1186058 RepID=J6ES05_TRIAS|nr:hypothetical protein A1Q1_03943 [Trichosporon asahii var. asahii CBS 2479]EJT47314.1 hypothetical protein A1Q1_03943 [Trichosporon asahii var. asahii CBS 2479]
MKVSALFLVLAAVATAAPAVQPEPAARGLLDPVTGAVGSATGAVNGAAGGLGALGGLLDPVTGALAGITGPISDLLHNLIAGVDQKVLPILAGQDDSVVHQTIETINRVLAGLPLGPTGLPDTNGLTASLEQALNGVLANQGVVSQVLQAVEGALAGGLPVKRALPLPIDINSLNLAGLGPLSGLLNELLQLLNGLISGLTGGKALGAADLKQLTDKINAVTGAVGQGKAAGIDTSALSGLLGPLLTTVDTLLSAVTGAAGGADKAVADAQQAVVGATGGLLTGLSAVKGLEGTIRGLLASLHLDGPLGGLVSTLLAVIDNLLGGLGLGGLLSGVGL